MADYYLKLPPSSGGGGGAVDSVNGQTGVVVLTKSSIGLGNVNNTSDATKNAATATLTNKTIISPLGTVNAPAFQFDSDTGLYSTGDGNLSIASNGFQRININQNTIELAAPTSVTVSSDLIVTGNISAANYPPTGTINTFAGFDSSGDLESVPGFNIDNASGGLNENVTLQPNDNGSLALNSVYLGVDPLQDSPNDAFSLQNNTLRFDPNSTGFTVGTNGFAGGIFNNNISHQGTSDVGSTQFINNNFNIGNGTDAISVGNIGYVFGFGNVNANVTLAGGMQGYGFQSSVDAAATIPDGANITGFYDFTNIACSSPNYTSFAAGPNIAELRNNNGYQGINLSGNMPLFSGNAGYAGMNVTPNIGTIGTVGVGGQFQGINISPTITNNVNSAVGINVNMGNVTNAAGAQASLVVQDITYTFNQAGQDGNNIAVEYTDTTTAGNEVATITPGSPTVIVVTIESGVSTATQVKAALDANVSILTNMTTVITGTASNAQVTYAQTNLAGGINPGNKKAAQFNGDVDIQGALSFTGALNLGQLTSFASVNISAYPTGVNAVDTLITQPTVDPSTTLNTDLLSINTAMLLTVGAGSTLTSSFLGYVALGLPAVVNLGAGSTIDRVGGATFAISLDAGAGAGSAIDTVDLCRAIAIPNGVTTIDKLVGYKMDLPFGDPGTNSWGLYVTPTINNYMAGALKVGGGTDVPDSGYTLHAEGDTQLDGDVLVTGNLNVSTGASGTFTTVDLKTVTVTNGIITSIV